MAMSNTNGVIRRLQVGVMTLIGLILLALGSILDRAGADCALSAESPPYHQRPHNVIAPRPVPANGHA
jgi:hypothetical protein